MKLYRLRIVIHTPDNTAEGKYLGEVPALPGCRAWGDTPAETLEKLQSVAGAFIESYRSRGDSFTKGGRGSPQQNRPGASS